tara:strand:+ start:9 stop:161 length:153 start_codon:yes stop_codon:yes gene_type:complete
VGKLSPEKLGNFSKFYSRKNKKITAFELIINLKKGQPILAHDKFLNSISS